MCSKRGRQGSANFFVFYGVVMARWKNKNKTLVGILSSQIPLFYAMTADLSYVYEPLRTLRAFSQLTEKQTYLQMPSISEMNISK